MRRPLLLLCLAASAPAAPALAQEAPPPAAAAPAEAGPRRGLTDAWAALAVGRARPAEVAFLGLAADAGPAEGGPLLGAGLAAAVTGNPDRAVQRIRLALARDPAAFRSLPAGGPGLEAQLRTARSALEADLLASDDPVGVLLASAAVDYLLGELPTARLSLAAAVRREGLQPPMRSLDRLLQQAGLSEREGTFVAPALAQAAAEPSAEPEPAAPPAAAAAPAPDAAPAPEATQPPRLLRPNSPDPGPTPDPGRPKIFFDYEKLNLRVSEMAGSLQSFEQKLLQSLMRPPAEAPTRQEPEAPE